MTASTTAPLHILRGILRVLKRSQRISSSYNINNINTASSAVRIISNSPTQMKDHLLDQYRKSRSASPERVILLRKLAYDFYTLQKDLAERARLYELDSGAEKVLTPKELSQRAAARSGLQLPKLFEEDIK